MRIGIIGGTGKEGRGLAVRWALAGHRVTLGSRDAERARRIASELSPPGSALPLPLPVEGATNAEACRDAEVVVLSVPYSGHRSTLGELGSALAGKVLLDITVPLKPPAIRRVHLPRGRAAALEAQSILGPTVTVVAALHHVSSVHLADATHAVDCDVLVCSDDDAARSTIIGLVSNLGLRGLDAGPLENAIALESLTPVLLHLNKRYGSAGTGIRFTGLPP